VDKEVEMVRVLEKDGRLDCGMREQELIEG